MFDLTETQLAEIKRSVLSDLLTSAAQANIIANSYLIHNNMVERVQPFTSVSVQFIKHKLMELEHEPTTSSESPRQLS